MSSRRRPSSEELAAATYRKSSFSGANNECIEIAELAGRWVAVRDSKDPAGGALCFPASEFAAFITDVRNGRFTG